VCTAAPAAAASSSTSDAASSLHAVLEEHGIELERPLDDASLSRLPSRLQFLESLGVGDVAMVARRHPSLLHVEPEELQPRLKYLLNLGLSDLATTVGKAPALLSCDLTRDFHQKVAILGSLGVKDMLKVLTQNTKIVYLDVEKDMRPAVELLRSIPGLDVGRVISGIPSVVFDTKYVQKRIDYLTEIGVRKMGSVITRHPMLLAYSIEDNMKLKVSGPLEWDSSPRVPGPRRCTHPHPVASPRRPSGTTLCDDDHNRCVPEATPVRNQTQDIHRLSKESPSETREKHYTPVAPTPLPDTSSASSTRSAPYRWLLPTSGPLLRYLHSKRREVTPRFTASPPPPRLPPR